MRFCYTALLFFMIMGCKNDHIDQKLNHKYTDNNLPGDTAMLFSPGIISSGFHDDAGPQFTADFKSVYYRIAQVPHSIIIERKRNYNTWSEAEIVSFSGQYNDGVPALKPDGSRLYFESYRPIYNSTKVKDDEDLWYVEKIGGDWSEPIHLNGTINSEEGEFGASIASNGNLYFTSSDEDVLKIFLSEFKDGEHLQRKELDQNINNPNAATPCISPDESYIIFSSFNREDSFGGLDLYISFKNHKEEWGPAINLSRKVNSKYNDYFPSLSPDGEYLFFVSGRGNEWSYSSIRKTYKEMLNIYSSPRNGRNDVYWVKTEFLNKLKTH